MTDHKLSDFLPPPMRDRLIAPSQCAALMVSGEYIIKNLLYRGNVCCIFGHPGSGKSVIAPHLAYAIAQGRPVFGMRTKACKVLYAVAEDYNGMLKRVEALRRKYGDAPNFRLLEIGSLLDEKESAEFVTLAAEYDLVIVDTMPAAFAGYKENDPDGMGDVIKFARKIARSGAAVILIHHPAKNTNDTPRGHGSLNGTLEMSMFIPKDPPDGITRAAMKKNKNGPLNLDIAFSIKAADLGHDIDGDVITAPIASEVSGHAQVSPQPVAKLSGGQKLAMLALDECLMASGVVQMSGDRTCAVEAWREAFYSRKGTVSQEAKKKAFQRAQEELQTDGLIEVRGVLVWRKDKNGEADTFSTLAPPEAGDLEELLEA